MSQRSTLPDDPQQPSTSTAAQRRHTSNREEFDKIFKKKPPVTLWNVCVRNGRGKSMYNYQSEIRSLRGLSFNVLLKPYETFLTDLAVLSSSTFADLCQNLRFLAFHRKLPAIICSCPRKQEAAREFFKLVANCIQYQSVLNGIPEWTAQINQGTLMDRDIVRNLNRLNLSNVKHEVPDDLPTTSTETFRIRRHVFREPFNPSADEHLRDQHFLDDVGSNDHKFVVVMEKIVRAAAKNNMANRTKAIELSDVEYYGDEHVLQPPQVTFRLDNMLQVPDFKISEFEEDGYFPPDRTDRAWYLYEQYEKANAECTSVFSQLRPSGAPLPKPFEKSYPLSSELLEFHALGRHIHGFFEVWRETDRGWRDKNGQWVARRYLVDIYNQIRFPLYVKFEWWPPQLRWAFDKISLYSLKLMTLVRKHSQELKSLGAELFARYPANVHDFGKYSIMTTKGRQNYLTSYQIENNRVLEKCMASMKQTKSKLEEEMKKRKRRSKKGEENPSPKVARTPRKQVFTPSAAPAPASVVAPAPSPAPAPTVIAQTASVIRNIGVQKENVQVSPHSVALIRRRNSMESPRHPPTQQSPVAPKRRHDEYTINPSQLPPNKKPSLDSWDEHLHNSMEEEHVDEEVDSEEGRREERDERDDAMVWVPADRGHEVAPEQYAREILEHFSDGVKKGEEDDETSPGPAPVKSSLSAPTFPAASPFFSGPLADLVADTPPSGSVVLPPPIPAPKQRRSRKSNTKPENTAQAQEEHPTTSETPATPSNSIMIPVRSMTVPKQRVYSIKHTPPSASKAVYPVKKLTSSAGAPGASNGVTFVNPTTAAAAALAMKSTYMPTKRTGPTVTTTPIAGMAHPQQIGLSKEALSQVSAVQKQPSVSDFPAGMRHKNGVDSTTSSASSSSITHTPFRPNVPPGTIRALHRSPMIIHPTSSAPTSSVLSSASRSSADSSTVSTPASRALVQQRFRQSDFFPDSSKCRRAMSYNDQMVYKNRKWDPFTMKSAQSTIVPVRALPVAAPIQQYRPRSYSNQNGASAPVATSSSTAEQSTDLHTPISKPRSSVPWNSHRIVQSASSDASSSAPIVATMAAPIAAPIATPMAVPMVTPLAPPTPMLAPIQMPQFPVNSAPALLVPAFPVAAGPAPQARTTTTAYTVMDSTSQNPTPIVPLPGQLLSIGSYTKMVRKTHGGTLTPEELGDAVRTESQRFHEATGEEGPTVKSFLLNLQQK